MIVEAGSVMVLAGPAWVVVVELVIVTVWPVVAVEVVVCTNLVVRTDVTVFAGIVEKDVRVLN